MSAPVADVAATGVKWDLSALFSSIEDPKIDETWARVNEAADAFATTYRGMVGGLTGAQLAAAIKELESISNEAGKPGSYASLRFAGDTSDPKIGSFYQQQAEKGSELRVKLMFFSLELMKADQGWADEALKAPEMATYKHFMDTTRALSQYMLSETEEILLEEVSNTGSRAWQRLHDELTANQVFNFANPVSGETEELTEGEVLEKMRDPNRAVRQAAADSLTAGLSQLQRPLCFLYNTLLADKKLEDRLRKMPYAEMSRHLDNELDKETVDLVMQLCKERSDLVARYYRVKKQILGLDTLTEYDRYAPLFETKEQVPYTEAREIVLDAFGKFSTTMQSRAAEFFDKNWIDAEPRKGKTGGAFCSYITPDLHPVILMTYLGSLENVSTLAHELGHGVHSSLSRAQTKFNYHGTLPLAELASIFGEMLVFEKLTASVGAKDQLALYAGKLEGIWASVHRQSAMFRFEQRCHEWRRTKGELSPDDFSDIWQEEIQSMFGDSVALGEGHRIWWSYVGHFIFAPFYVYAYSFGELLTMAVYQKSKTEGPGFAAKYEEVLRLGGSKTPDELMAILGVDLRSKAFWEGGFAAIEAMVERFEALWAEVSG